MRTGTALEIQGSVALATGSEFELRNPHPIAATLPGVFRESWIDEQRRTAREPFGTRFLSALDTVLAPVLSTLDNMDWYFDPDTTPEDFLAWLGSWVAASVDGGWPEDRRRAFVGKAAELYRRRGTAAGLRDHVQIHTGGVVEIVENGASSWSASAEGKLPGTPEPVVIVRVTVDDPDSIDKVKLESLVAVSKPAHVVHRVEVLGTAQRAGRVKAATVQSVASEAPAAETPTVSKTTVEEVMPIAPERPAGDVAAPSAPEPDASVDAPAEAPATKAKPAAKAAPTAVTDAEPADAEPASKSTAKSTTAKDAGKAETPEESPPGDAAEKADKPTDDGPKA
jgi:phage tail-like protein